MSDRKFLALHGLRSGVILMTLLPLLFCSPAQAAGVPPQSAKSREQVEALVASWKKRIADATSIEQRLAAFRSFIETTPEPTRVQIRRMDADGVSAELIWPARLHHPLGKRAILYVHGGGFHGGSLRTHRLLAGSLAKAASSDVLLIDYRLLPEARYPSQIEEVRTAFRWLLDNGYERGNIVIAGDGVGGNLAIEAVLRQKAGGRQLPAAVIALSPVTDLSASGASMTANAATDPITGKADIEAMARAYLGSTSPSSPDVSPLFADMTGFPPLMLQVSEGETLLDDTLRLADKAQKAGVDVTLEVWPGLTHSWQLFPSMLDDADISNQRIADFAVNHFADKPQQ